MGGPKLCHEQATLEGVQGCAVAEAGRGRKGCRTGEEAHLENRVGSIHAWW